MAGFRRQLDRLREHDVDAPLAMSIPDQLRFLRDSTGPGEFRIALPDWQRLPPGRAARTPLGCHYVIERDYADPHFHGTVRLARFSDDDFMRLLEVARVSSPGVDRERIVFLDTETTGVRGGAGMCPFLIGVGFFSDDRFVVRQYFIRDFEEEASMLADLGKFLGEYEWLVTYNGRAFDVPIVENRYTLARMDRPFGHMRHLDLLYIARRLWKAGHGSCRLTRLEARLVRFLRGPDIHGSRIPAAYFHFLRTRDGGVLESVFSHNAYDILSLAALAVLAADKIVEEPAQLDDPRDVFSLARIFDRGGERDRSIRYYQHALDAGALPDNLRIFALERLSVLCRKAGRARQAFDCCRRLMAETSLSVVGYEGASIYFERETRDLTAATRVLEEAILRFRRTEGMQARLRKIQTRHARLRAKSLVRVSETEGRVGVRAGSRARRQAAPECP